MPKTSYFNLSLTTLYKAMYDTEYAKNNIRRLILNV